jgi:prevent-host-death family protein
MIRFQDIQSLTDFTRHAKAHLKRLKRTGQPVILTINGKAEVVVQSAAAYQRLFEARERAKRDRREKSDGGRV